MTQRVSSTSRSPKKANRRKASGKVPTPKNLERFMLQGWKDPSKRTVAPVKAVARYQSRREALGAGFPSDVLIIPTGHEQVRANDTHFLFRPGSDFFYLTGDSEPDCVLFLEPRRGKPPRSVLYAEPNPGRSDPTFFTDKDKGELWVGPRLGLPESRVRFGVDEVKPLSELRERFSALKATKKYRVVRGISEKVDKALPARKKEDDELAVALSEMRLIKDAMELAALQRAAQSTRRGFEDVIRTMKTAKNEREIESAFYGRSRREGNGPGYNIIAAAGSNACILHWNRNDGAIRKSDLLLVDAGVESNELYTADVTRTLPVKGVFSKAQRQIYDLVIEAQAAAIAEIKPGNRFLAPHDAAMRTLAAGLLRLKIMTGTIDEVMAPENQFYKRYTLHGTSHMLGLDVHDCSRARAEKYRLGELESGMVLTVEPGLYFQPDDETVPTRFRGIGVRIEDDVAVTSRGNRVLTDIPRTSDDVERWIARIWSQS